MYNIHDKIYNYIYIYIYIYMYVYMYIYELKKLQCNSPNTFNNSLIGLSLESHGKF